MQYKFEWHKSIQGFRYMASTNLAQVLPHLISFGPWTSPYGANEQIIMTVHNYKCRQVPTNLNGLNPFSGFRDMRSAKSGPNLCQIWQVLGPWARSYGAKGQMTMALHNYRPRQFHRTWHGGNLSGGYIDMGSASLDSDDNTPPARRAIRDV